MRLLKKIISNIKNIYISFTVESSVIQTQISVIKKYVKCVNKIRKMY